EVGGVELGEHGVGHRALRLGEHLGGKRPRDAELGPDGVEVERDDRRASRDAVQGHLQVLSARATRPSSTAYSGAERALTQGTKMTDTARPPVTDWATDFDHTRPEYAQNAPEIWEELRSECPVAHTDRFGGAWLPVRHDDVAAIARDTENFSSEGVIVNDFRPVDLAPIGYAPPITSDPPFHQVARRLLLPAFAPKQIDRWEPVARA